MWWPFKKRQRAPITGSFMNESGSLMCACGTEIPIALSCVLTTVPKERFLGMKPPEVLLNGIPCPDCERSHSVRMRPGHD